MRLAFALLLAAGGVLGQDREPPASSRIEGVVLSETGIPLRRARVTLRPLEAGLAAIGVEADDRGAFAIRDIPQGRYAISAQRDGYLEASVATRGGLRMPSQFTLSGGQTVAGVTFRLRPWSVLAGKVRYDDGEPAVGIRVDLYRQQRLRGQVRYFNVAAAVSDDRGEYRIHSLAPGEYYIAAVYDRPASQIPADEQGREVPVLGYVTTFYPDTTKLSEAIPVRLEAARELGGMDVFLQRTRKVKLRGRVTNGENGAAIRANLFLARLDAENASALSAPVTATFDASLNFEIRNVAAGPWELWAEADFENRRLIARQAVLVTGDDVEGIELIASPGEDWSGRIRFEGGEAPGNFSARVRLEPRSGRGLGVEVPTARREFKLSVMPEEVYDVFVTGLPGDYYLASVRAAGIDARAYGLAASAASQVPFEIVLDARGGRVGGQVIDAAGKPMSGATVVLIPDPVEARLQDYREAAADEYGQFAMRGVAPGKYTLVAWLDDAPCDIYDANALDGCRAAGASITVAPLSEQVSVFTVRAK